MKKSTFLGVSKKSIKHSFLIFGKLRPEHQKNFQIWEGIGKRGEGSTKTKTPRNS